MGTFSYEIYIDILQSFCNKKRDQTFYSPKLSFSVIFYTIPGVVNILNMMYVYGICGFKRNSEKQQVTMT